MSNDLLPSSQLPGVTRFQWQQLLGPIVVVVIVAYAASSVSASFAFLTEGTLALLVMVLALQVLIGNSGVLSFGQAAFAMVGGFATGLLTVPVRIKENVLDELWEPLKMINMGIYPSLVIAVAIGAFLAFITGLFLMRLSGLAAGIATFAVLMVADNVLFNWKLIGPGPQVMPQVPKFGFIDESIAIAVLSHDCCVLDWHFTSRKIVACHPRRRTCSPRFRCEYLAVAGTFLHRIRWNRGAQRCNVRPPCRCRERKGFLSRIHFHNAGDAGDWWSFECVGRRRGNNSGHGNWPATSRL